MPNLHAQRPLLAAVAVFLLAATVAETLIWRSEQRERQEQRTHVDNLAGARASMLQGSIQHGLSATYVLAALVRQSEGAVRNFDDIAGRILPAYPEVSGLALAPAGIIRDVAPRTGNEMLLGRALLQEPEQQRAALRAQEEGRLTLAGPQELAQGGAGLVGRLPVFLDGADGKRSFWGYTLVTMHLPRLLQAANIPPLAQRGYAYELSRMHPDTGQMQVIAASSTGALLEPVVHTLEMPSANWTLSIAPLAGWGAASRVPELALGLLVSLLLAYLAKLLLELRAHRVGLEALVEQRTADARAREADLNRAQAVARTGSWVLNIATNELLGSAEGLRILGASGSGPIRYQAFLSLVHPDDREAVDQASRASRKGEPYDLEYRVLVDGETRWVRSQAELTFSADGRLSSALGTIQDITEHKIAEQALRASVARYRELFDENPQPMWVWDLQTLGFLAVNDAAVAHYGYSRDEFLAMMVTDIRPPEQVPRLLQRAALLQKQNMRDAGIWRHRKKDGTLIDVEITSHTLVFGGRRAQMVLANDVTERLQAERKLRESEARLRSLTELSSDFYWESDIEHRLTMLSTGAEDSSRVLPQGSPLGKRRWDVPYHTPDKNGWEVHRAMMEAHQPFRDFEFSRLGVDGIERHIAISGAPVFDDSGAFQGYRGVGKHITERKMAETRIARLTQLYAALSQCNQAIVRCASERELLHQICRVAVAFGGMKLAWIGFVEPGTSMVRYAAGYGDYADEYLHEIEISVDAATEFGRGPTGTAIRENRAVWCHDFTNDAMTAPWQERRARYGFAASASLPLHRGGVAVGALNLYAGDTGAFDEAVSELLIEMAADISFALDNFERESRREQAEAALQESEARFRSLTEMSSDFYWESDAEHRLTARGSANRKLSMVSMFRQGAQIGERRWEIPHLSPDEAGWEAHRAVLDAHLPFREFELSRLGIDGAERHMSISGDPVFDASGAFKGYRGVGTDITERKRRDESLRRFRAAMDATADAVYLTDRASLRFIDVNAAACRMQNRSREELLALGPHWVLSKSREQLARDYDAVIAAGTAMAPVEMQRRREDGSQVWVELERRAQRSGEGWTIVTVVRDITERKKSEVELRRLNEELEQRVVERTQALEAANKELEAFSYSVSHDLRAPLRTIHGFSSLLQTQHAGQLDAEGLDMLGRVAAGAQKMGRLIDDLLKLSRISRQAMRKKPVDLSTLAREVADELHAAEPERRVEWVIAPQMSAEGDPGLLRVVLQNLIGNAWKYSSRQDAARIEFGVGENDGRRAYFVRDNGVGFDMAYASKLFGAFQRLHSAAEFPGSGIGLATVARILHRHGGNAWAEARVGEGATFYFSLG